jgi:myo-inositol-1(or 4)-monophosphatase
VTLSGAAIDERFGFALDLIKEAGALALSYYRDLGPLDIHMKGPQDHFSEADVLTERLIRDALARRFPGDGFVGEESAFGEESLFGEESSGSPMGAGDPVWVVDPIDGTQPFLLELPTWCVSIALVANGDIQIGLVFSPATDELFAARRGAGATLNTRPARVREAHALTDGLTTVGCSPRTQPADLGVIMERLLAGGGMFHRTGSGAISLCYVAAGRMIGYLEMHINSWDCLAAILIIEEAGGRVSPFLAVNGVSGGGPIVAASPGVYDQVAALLP